VYGGARGSAGAEVRFGGDVSIAFAAFGSRTWMSGRPSAPEPFESVPIRPELAFGGAGHQLNPSGRGMVSDDGSPLPNLERIDAPLAQPSDRPSPVLLGPLGRTHPLRTSRLGTYDGSWQRSRWPYFPDDFDWSFFNAAPPELRVPHPSGTERFLFAGMHPELPVLEGTLPELTPRAFVQRLARPDELEPVRLRIDTLHFVPDRLALVMVWRGVVDVRDEEASDLGAVFVCAEEGAERFDTAELGRRFERRVRERVVRIPETEEGDAAADDAEGTEPAGPPDGVSPPRGLTPTMAAALGLPPWTATLPEPQPRPPREEPPEPPPAPAMSKEAVERELAAGASFAGRDLSDCDLSGLCFDGCDLSDAQLPRARLDGATFRGADLARAVLTDVCGPGVVMRGADLSEADLSGAALGGVELDGARLVYVSLAGARLEGASFAGIHGAGSVWSDAVLRGARFSGADLEGADFSGANLEAVVFEDVTFEDGRLYEVEAEGLTVRRARAARLRVDAARLARSVWEELEAPDSSWRDADLAGARLGAADLARAIFVNADLTDAELDRIDGTEALFRLAKLVRRGSAGPT